LDGELARRADRLDFEPVEGRILVRVFCAVSALVVRLGTRHLRMYV
jgi:hypothetical protein